MKNKSKQEGGDLLHMGSAGREWRLVWSPVREAQEAVIGISYGLLGGMGEAALDPAGKILHMEDRPVYWDSRSRKAVMEQVQVPAEWSGVPVIVVKARIRTEQRTQRNMSIPGAPERTFFAVVLEELHGVAAYFEPVSA